jgi:outer membrane protein
MKIFNTILSILLLVAVIVLFSKVYSSGDASSTQQKPTEDQTEESFQGAKIAYIESDTLIARYEYRKELSAKFEARAKKAEAELAVYSKAFEENYRVLLEQRDKLSPQQLQSAQMELQQKEQEIMQMRDQKTAELQQEEAELTQLVMDDVREVVEELKTELGVDYILSKGQGSNVMSANEQYNITEMVITRLNKRYEDKQKETEKDK